MTEVTVQRPPGHLILFDGVCSFCHRWVRFILRRDRKQQFFFVSRESAIGQSWLQTLPPELASVDTIILWKDSGEVLTKSKAGLAILSELGPLWKILSTCLAILPSRCSDHLYDFIARRRYRWFGQLPTCPIPPPRWQERFLSDPHP